MTDFDVIMESLGEMQEISCEIREKVNRVKCLRNPENVKEKAAEPCDATEQLSYRIGVIRAILIEARESLRAFI
jgi:hypothetical protein